MNRYVPPLALALSVTLAAGGAACSGTDDDVDGVDVTPGDTADTEPDAADDVSVDVPAEDTPDGDDADDAPDSADVVDAPDVDDAPDSPDVPDADAADVPDIDAADVDAGDADVGEVGDTTDVEEDASGCVPTSDPPDDTPFFIEIGVGEDSLTTANCTETMLAQGFQGGFHIWGAARGVGLSTSEPELDVTARNASGELMAAVYYTFPWDLVGGERQITGITVFLDVDVRPDSVDGEVWELCATANDGVGTASDCMDIVVRCCDYLD